MKLFSTAIISLLFAGSVFAGCPSKTIKGKVVSFDEESKTLTVAQGKKEKKVQVGSKTKMEGFECPTKLEAEHVFLSMDVTAKTKLQPKLPLQKERKKKVNFFLRF